MRVQESGENGMIPGGGETMSYTTNNFLRIQKPPEPSETEILRGIRQYLQVHGWYVIRHHQGLGCHKGLSDLTAIRNGVTVYIECKKRNGYQSAVQKKFQADVEAHGARYILAKGIEDVKCLCEKAG